MTNDTDIPDDAGVALDQHVETMVEADHAEATLRRMYVDLDSIADTHDLPGHLVQDVRGIQMDVETLADEFEEAADEHAEKAAALRERMYGDAWRT